MVAILSQDRKSILNTDTVEKVYVDGTAIYAQSLGGTSTKIGTYEKSENLVKVMNYIGFCLGSTKDGNKTVVMPSDEVVSNDKIIVEHILKSMSDKQSGGGGVGIEISSELKDILDRMNGGDKK